MLLGPDEAASLVARPGAGREVSVLRERPFLAIDLRDGPSDEGGSHGYGTPGRPAAVALSSGAE